MDADSALAIDGTGRPAHERELARARTLIELRDVRRKRGKSFELRLPSMDVVAGEITAVVGPNGSGKTTLLEILAGSLALDGGTLRHRFRSLDDPWGQVLGDCGPVVDLVRYRREVAFVPSTPIPFSGKLRNELELVSAESGYRGNDAAERADWWIKRLGLDAYSDRRFRQLSDGYRMRATIALELVRQPQVLILDEPIGPLDVKAQQVVLSDLRDIASSERWPLPIVISSQHLHEIEAVADRLVFIRDGEAAFSGTRDELRSERRGSAFELRCSLPDDAVRAALGDAIHVTEGHRARATLVRSETRIESSDVLGPLLAAGAQIEAFRDITGSSRMLFEEDSR